MQGQPPVGPTMATSSQPPPMTSLPSPAPSSASVPQTTPMPMGASGVGMPPHHSAQGMGGMPVVGGAPHPSHPAPPHLSQPSSATHPGMPGTSMPQGHMPPQPSSSASAAPPPTSATTPSTMMGPGGQMGSGGAGMYSFKPLSTPQHIAQQAAAAAAAAAAGGGPHLPPGAANGVPTGMAATNGPSAGVGPGGPQLMGSGGTPLTPQQLQGAKAAQQIQQQLRALQASRAGSHTMPPSMVPGMGGPGPMMQINPSQLTASQGTLGSGHMGPPTGMTVPGRMGGAVGGATNQWMGRPGLAAGPQRPARYQQEPTDILTKQKLQELIRQVAPNDRLEPEVEELLQDIAEDFVESVTTFACSLAKLRKSDCLDAKDVALHLERNWNLQIPGYSSELEIVAMAPSLTSSSTTTSLKRPLPEGHKQRLAFVKKTMALQRKREEREREKEEKERKQKEERDKQQLLQLNTTDAPGAATTTTTTASAATEIKDGEQATRKAGEADMDIEGQTPSAKAEPTNSVEGEIAENGTSSSKPHGSDKEAKSRPPTATEDGVKENEGAEEEEDSKSGKNAGTPKSQPDQTPAAVAEATGDGGEAMLTERQ